MKRSAYRIQRTLFWSIGVLAIALTTVLIHKGFELYKERVYQEELNVRNQEVQAELDDIRMQIKNLSGDGEVLKNFLDEKINSIKEAQQDMIPTETEAQEVLSSSVDTGEENAIIITAPDEVKPQNNNADDVSANSVENGTQEETISGNDAGLGETVSGNDRGAGFDETVSGNGLDAGFGETVSGNGGAESEETVSGNGGAGFGETVSGNGGAESEETVSGNGGAESRETVSGNDGGDGQVLSSPDDGTTLEEKQDIRSSYSETMQINSSDKEQIANSTVDFSDMKIACLGDSLTEGSNMSELDDYEKYSYPSVLKNLLNAEAVYNLGVGGSSYGRYWDKAFVDRYEEIPEDSDIIIVMGGTNDGFAASAEELGNIDERKRRTFYGDVDELMRGLKADYPNAKIIFATPLPNVLHDYLRAQRDYLLPQSVFADAIKELAAEYDIDVIDLYNSNMLDTHDAQIISEYMPDGVHGNPSGYQILAEHFAGGLIRIMEQDALYNESIGENSSLEEAVSENNKRVSDSAIVVTAPEPAEDNADTTAGQGSETQKSEKSEKSEEQTQNNYVYDGEAIIIY